MRQLPPHVLVRAAVDGDLEAINRIYNDEVIGGVATWDLEPWSAEQRRAWFAHQLEGQHLKGQHREGLPVLVAEVQGEVAGFAYLSIYRERAGYRHTREDTVYVAPAHQRLGVGRALLGTLIEEARRAGVHCLVARIDAENTASIALHRAFGFETIGIEREVGRKFDRWLDLHAMQLLLDSERR